MKAICKEYLPWLLTAVIFSLAAAAGVFYKADMFLSDAVFQKRQPTDERIVIVGIDDKALAEIGPFQTWKRGVMARVLDYLNQWEDNRPAVIGLDVLYAGETEQEQDEWLAAAAGAHDNVVTAVAARFGSSLVSGGDGSIYMDRFAVQGFDGPYDALAVSTTQGHINAMYDADGMMRHALLQISVPDGRIYPSFSMAVAEKYQGETEPPPVDSKGFWYLNYSGKPGDYYDSISLADVLSEKVPREYFAGKIVLIGPYAAGLTDQYMTAIDHTQTMYGVEIQANAIHALLEKDFKKEVTDGIQLLALAVTMLLLALWFKGRKILLTTAAWIIVSGGWLCVSMAAYAHGYVLHILWFPLGASVLFVVSAAANYALAAAEKRQVMTTFKRYVAPEIVDEILKKDPSLLELGGRKCEIAVLFVDIRGFTAMSEVLGPQQMVEILNRYLTLTSSCIMGQEGTLDKFIGDATMAFWGAPLPQKDYVMKAVKAALDIVEGSGALNEELEKRYGRRVSFGIGIHTGPAVVGNIGAVNRMDYTAIGDTVNTASRLESIAPGGTIFISRAVADALEGRIKVSLMGTGIRLKGKTEGFEVWKLEGIVPPADQ